MDIYVAYLLYNNDLKLETVDLYTITMRSVVILLTISSLTLWSKPYGAVGFYRRKPKAAKVFEKHGIHEITLAKYSQMSTHVPGFQSYFRGFASFCIRQISHQQHKGYYRGRELCWKSPRSREVCCI